MLRLGTAMSVSSVCIKLPFDADLKRTQRWYAIQYSICMNALLMAREFPAELSTTMLH